MKRTKYIPGLAISPYRPGRRIHASAAWSAYKAGIKAERREHWMEKARQHVNDGCTDAAAHCVAYAREMNREMIACLRGLRI